MRHDVLEDRAQPPPPDGGHGSSESDQMDGTGLFRPDDSHIWGEATKRMSANGSRRRAILAKASLTSMLFELVRSDPWDTVMRAGISGLEASCSSDERRVSVKVV